MVRETLQRARVFFLLHRIDVDLAESARSHRCRQDQGQCGGPLHSASYPRKPRGGPEGLPEELSVRLGLCCGWCRCRTLPPSVLFWDRKVYWGVAILVLTALGQQRTEGFSARKLSHLFGVSRSTLARWLVYFREVFPQSRSWLLLRGRLLPPVAPQEIPREFLARFVDPRADPVAGLIACLRALRLGAA